MIVDLKTESDFEDIRKLSHRKPVFLLKHSSTCPISAGVWEIFQKFAVESREIECRRVLVRENKLLSARISEMIDIEHKSPQVILFHNGKPVWHANHYEITETSLKDALGELG